MPNLSYDVDGDGMVSQIDYYLAKKYDADKDGILQENEKA